MTRVTLYWETGGSFFEAIWIPNNPDNASWASYNVYWSLVDAKPNSVTQNFQLGSQNLTLWADSQPPKMCDQTSKKKSSWYSRVSRHPRCQFCWPGLSIEFKGLTKSGCQKIKFLFYTNLWYDIPFYYKCTVQITEELTIPVTFVTDKKFFYHPIVGTGSPKISFILTTSLKLAHYLCILIC